MAKENVKNTDKGGNKRAPLDRATKVARRLNGVSAKTPFKLKSALFTVEAIAKVPQSIQGFIVSRDKDSVAFRHKRTSASKTMVVTIFPTSDILELFGNENEVAELTVLRDTVIRKAIGTVEQSHNSVTVNTPNGERVTFFRSSGVTINVFAEDKEGSAPSTRGKKKAEVVDIKSSSKKKRRNDDDGDL